MTMQRLSTHLILFLFMFCASFLTAEGAYAGDVPAKFVKDISCAGNWPGSFWDIGTNACWECPKTAPKRTILPVTEGWACEQPAHEIFKPAKGPENPTGFIKTDCRKGWFLDIGHGKCYSCEGYNRTLYPVTHARACSKLVPIVKAKATRRGSPSCPEGSFQHLLSSNCYSCPNGSFRNANTGADPTKFGACTVCGGMGGKPCPVTTLRKSCDDGLVENFVMGKCVESDAVLLSKLKSNKAKFEAQEAQIFRVLKAANMPRAPSTGGESGPPNELQILFGSANNSQRVQLMKNLLDEQGGGIVTLVSGGSGSIGLGYGHTEGYAMKKSGGYVCRKIWNNAFTAGLSVGGSGGWEVGSWTSPSFDDLGGETNGISGGLTLLVAGWTPGTHWSASTGAHAGTTLMNGMNAVGLDVGIDYVHGWTKVDDHDTPCDEAKW